MEPDKLPQPFEFIKGLLEFIHGLFVIAFFVPILGLLTYIMYIVIISMLGL